MKGIHHVAVSNAAVRYEFDIRRNITIIKGDSATGKTTLVELIGEYYESGEESGVTLICDKLCRVIAGRDWKVLLSTMQDTIVFIDEDNSFLPFDDFAEAVKNSDNYYVIVTREGLPNLPYSVDEIYGIRTSGKYAGLKQVYHEFFHIYGDHIPYQRIAPDVLIVEDSNAGYEFFEGIADNGNYSVVSAGGKSNVFQRANELPEEQVVIIADGAAFGAEMDRVMKLVSSRHNITLYLPESFEWLLLSADLFPSGRIHEILNMPSKYIESSEYFSWERFFTHLLVEEAKDTYLKYSKKNLNRAYLQESIAKKIIQKIPDIDFTIK
jgi:hypothetical protein